MATQKNQTWDRDGNLIAEEEIEVPEPVISNAELRQAKQTLRNMVQTFYQDGSPTGTPTAAQVRNWLLALTAAVRYLYGEMDNETDD